MICPQCMSYTLDHEDLLGWKRCRGCRYSFKLEKAMIVLKELNPNNYKTTPEIDANLDDLLVKMNKVRSLYGKSMIVTSGLRSMEKHLDIYKNKGITDPAKIPMKSKHLFGQACDISDPKGELQKWCKENEDKLVEIGLWMEDFNATPNWCHFQTVQYGSWVAGKSRFFKP